MTATRAGFDHARWSAGAALPADCQVEFQRLAKLVQARQGKHQLLLIDCRSEPLRERIVAALEELFGAARPAARVALDAARQTTFAEVERMLIDAAATRDLVHVLGAAQWFAVREHGPGRWESFNLRREAIAQNVHASLLFWLNAEAIADLAHLAADLWAWRAGVFEFAEEAVFAPDAPRLAARDFSLPDRRTLSERARRIGELKSALNAQPPLPDDSYFLLAMELGSLLRSIGRNSEAEKHYRDLAKRYELDPPRRANALGGVADVLADRGEWDEALRIRREEELPAYMAADDARLTAVTQSQIADILESRGELDEALRIRSREVLPAFERLGDARAKAIAQVQIADILGQRGELDEALRLYEEEALPVFERLGDAREKAIALGQIAGILQARGELDEALALHRQRLPIAEQMGDIDSVAHIKFSMARIRLARDAQDSDAPRAIAEELAEAYGISRKLGRPEAIGHIGMLYGQVLAKVGRKDEALEALAEAEAAFEKLGDNKNLQAVRRQRDAT